jgi:enoyl-CoA hydratase/carnithine racemase
METIRLERDLELPGLTTLTLARPEKLNAINRRMHEEVIAACRDLGEDAETRVVIVTGEGRAFSAGADLGTRARTGGSAGAEAASGAVDAGGVGASASTGGPAPAARPPLTAAANPLAERLGATIGNRSSAALEGLDQVTIGAVNGLAVGGAVVWLSCLDIRLAAESAWFSIPEVDLDIPLTWNALPRLVRELGPARTKELVLGCDRFSSADALSWGFVNRVYADAELLPAARALAGRLLAKDAISVALTKSTVNALANLMVPAEGTHADRDYLVLARLLRDDAARRGSAGSPGA